MLENQWNVAVGSGKPPHGCWVEERRDTANHHEEVGMVKFVGYASILCFLTRTIA
jgi:hypothetical protein